MGHEPLPKEAVKELALAAHAAFGVRPKFQKVYDDVFQGCPAWYIKSLPTKHPPQHIGAPAPQTIRAGMEERKHGGQKKPRDAAPDGECHAMILASDQKHGKP